MCEECKNEFKRLLNERIQDILAVRDESCKEAAESHCFHLMEMERLLDGQPVGFGRYSKP